MKMNEAVPSQIGLCSLIYKLLRECNDPRISDVTMDNDNDDGEIILTWDDGSLEPAENIQDELRDFVIKPSETNRDCAE